MTNEPSEPENAREALFDIVAALRKMEAERTGQNPIVTEPVDEMTARQRDLAEKTQYREERKAPYRKLASIWKNYDVAIAANVSVMSSIATMVKTAEKLSPEILKAMKQATKDGKPAHTVYAEYTPEALAAYAHYADDITVIFADALEPLVYGQEGLLKVRNRWMTQFKESAKQGGDFDEQVAMARPLVEEHIRKLKDVERTNSEPAMTLDAETVMGMFDVAAQHVKVTMLRKIEADERAQAVRDNGRY